MALRQEQVAFLGIAGLLGLLFWRTGWPSDEPSRSRPKSIDYEARAIPDVSRALAEGGAAGAPQTAALGGARQLFTPPRDTRPLPPLPLDPPPRQRLEALRPPPSPGPSPRNFGALLRRAVDPVAETGLFVETEEDGVLEFAEATDANIEGSNVAATDAGSGDEIRGGDELRDRLAELGYGGGSTEISIETPEERAARMESYRQLYDWLDLESTTDTLFGRIENPDRYGLRQPEHADDAILFRRVDPLTGEADVTGGAVQAYLRDLVTEFGFADTASNRLEVYSRELDEVTIANASEVTEFARASIDDRLEAPRALEIAEELLNRVIEFNARSVEAKLALAEVYEAGFRFEDAFGVYRGILEASPLEVRALVGLAELETRFFLHDSARAHFEEALGYERGSWLVRWRFGRYLLDRGEEGPALEHLRVASANAPESPSQVDTRVAIRNDLGAALLATGKVEEAVRVFNQALAADDESQIALAGLLSCIYLRPELRETSSFPVPAWVEDPTAGAAALEEGLGFELLLATGLVRLESQVWEGALSSLFEAVRADPLRGHLAWRGIVWAALQTDYPEEAWRFVEQAIEADPTDAWTLYTRGLLLAERDDVAGARASLQAALELELDFEDALAAMGELEFLYGDHGAADRYLDRALGLNAERADLWILSGLNLLELERIAEADEAFARAKALDPEDPTALLGLAWCQYRLGNPEEARVQLGVVDDMRREFDEDTDPYRLWATAQAKRIKEHAGKEAWSDSFNRSGLKNGWELDLGAGPLQSVVDGQIKIEGMFDESGRVRVYQKEKASLLVSFEADVFVSGDSAVRAGVFISKDRRNGDRWETQSGVSVSRHRDGVLQYLVARRGQPDDPVDVEWLDDFQTDRWVRLRIERTGDSADPRVTISVNGTPIAEEVSMPDLGHSQQDLFVGLFVEGDSARTGRVLMDNVEIVRSRPQ